MLNAKVRAVTLQQALSNEAFKSGFMDIAKANGWHERWDRVEQWNYERGRMFATWLKTQGLDPVVFPLKRGRWATKTTKDYFLKARRDNSIF